MSRPLDPDRPLWEVYLVEGLADGRFAIITKTHQAMVDGVTTIDIGQVLLDRPRSPREVPDELWMPRPEPTDARLVVDAVAEAIARPGQVVDSVRATANDALAGAARLARGVGALVGTVGPAAGWRPASRSTSRSPPSAGSPSPAATSRRTGRCAPRTGAR